MVETVEDVVRREEEVEATVEGGGGDGGEGREQQSATADVIIRVTESDRPPKKSHAAFLHAPVTSASN